MHTTFGGSRNIDALINKNDENQWHFIVECIIGVAKARQENSGGIRAKILELKEMNKVLKDEKERQTLL